MEFIQGTVNEMGTGFWLLCLSFCSPLYAADSQDIVQAMDACSDDYPPFVLLIHQRQNNNKCLEMLFTYNCVYCQKSPVDAIVIQKRRPS